MSNRDDFAQGLDVRRAVLGNGYVDKAIDTASDLEEEFQRFVTEYCWGSVWTDERLSRRERSLIVLAITGAMGRDREFKLHLRGALNNGLTTEELVSAIRQLAVYAGVPAGVSAMHLLREILGMEEREELRGDSQGSEGGPT